MAVHGPLRWWWCVRRQACRSFHPRNYRAHPGPSAASCARFTHFCRSRHQSSPMNPAAPARCPARTRAVVARHGWPDSPACCPLPARRPRPALAPRVWPPKGCGPPLVWLSWIQGPRDPGTDPSVYAVNHFWLLPRPDPPPVSFRFPSPARSPSTLLLVLAPVHTPYGVRCNILPH